MRRVVSVIGLLAACACVDAVTETPDLEIPIKSENLVGGDYVVFSTLWEPPDDGDSLVFLADGAVRSGRAELTGRWVIVDDSTVSIRADTTQEPRLFRVRIPAGLMVSPETIVTNDAKITIAHRGAMGMMRVGR